jgi:hypothetical protein
MSLLRLEFLIADISLQVSATTTSVTSILSVEVKLVPLNSIKKIWSFIAKGNEEMSIPAMVLCGVKANSRN